jgi:threonine dehydrogenase-like Zn-dependent dehydrogenase
MRQLTFEEAGRYAWRQVPDPEITTPEQALVRPLVVACCDLDVAVAHGQAPLPPGYAVGHEGLAEVVAVGDGVASVRPGDRVVVPFQISCGDCRECRRGATGSCGSVPLMAMYGLGPLAGLNGGGFMSDLVLVPYADAMLIAVPSASDIPDAVAIASLSDNIPDGWRAIGPYREELAQLDPVDRRVLVVGRLSIGLYAAAFAAALGAHVDYVDTDDQRLAAAEKLGVVAHDRVKPDKSWDPYPVTVHTSADPSSLAATLRATWPDGVCTDTGIYYQPTVEMPLLPMYTRGVRFVTGRVNARAAIPRALELLAGRDLSPAVDRVVSWEDAPSVWPAMTGKTVFTRA